MNAKLLSPSQAAQLLGIGGSTLRLWSGKFANHLSEAAQGGSGRRRHYTPDDIATLARARDMLRNGATVADVADRLGVVAPDAGSASLVTVAALSDELQSTRAALVTLADELRRRQDDHAASLAALQTANADAIANLTSQVADLRAQVATMQRAPWWRRLFNRPSRAGYK